MEKGKSIGKTLRRGGGRMREILFRGKDVYGIWHYGDLINLTDEIKQICNHTQLEHAHGVAPETVGQYTGLTDKNGKKIFEGDIVRYTRTNMYAPECSFHGQTIVSLHLILWDSSVSAFVSRHYSLPDKRIVGKGSVVLYDDRAKANIIEVIGNIYDNPELLEVE